MPWDKSNVYGSTKALAKQVEQAWNECRKINLPPAYRSINQLVIAGMGGSLLGARVLDSVYGLELSIPLLLVNDYRLPLWVNEKSLVIVSSYSGNTEEVLSISRQAIKQKAKIIAITAGGELLNLAQVNHWPYYQINPLYNPSNQPRMAIGYMITAILTLAAQLNLLTISNQEIDQIIKTMERISNQEQTAKEFAGLILSKQVIIAAAEHLTGPVHTVKNQMNENAKHLSHRHDLPELNHHLMEGLKFPQSNSDSIIFWLIDSPLYSSRLRQRLTITREVLTQNKISFIVWEASASTKLTQAFELIQFGALVNFYLSQLHQIDPAPIPWVDFFKQKLGKMIV